MGAPRFSDFKATPEHLKPVPPKITNEDRLFRTMIRVGAAAGPNFAGHYTFVYWGVGTGGKCWAKTGQIGVAGARESACLTTEGTDDQEPQFRIDSRLLILSGHLGDNRMGVAYFVWNGRRFEKLRFYPWDQLCHGRTTEN